MHRPKSVRYGMTFRHWYDDDGLPVGNYLVAARSAREFGAAARGMARATPHSTGSSVSRAQIGRRVAGGRGAAREAQD